MTRADQPLADLHHLDELDMRIIRELGGSDTLHWNIRESYSDIGRKLGVDEETVRYRVNRATERGLLPTWRLMVNPLVINHLAGNLEIQTKDEKAKPSVIAEVRDVDGVYSIVDFQGREIQVGFYYQNDSLRRKIDLLKRRAGGTKAEFWKRPFPKPSIRLNRLDWEIIDELYEDPRRNLDDVAESVGASERTVQRRLSALAGRRAVYLLRPPNVKAVEGLMCSFLVYFPDPDKKRVADRVVLSTFERLGISDTAPEHFSTFGIACRNFSEADTLTERLKAMDGAESVRTRIVKEIVFVDDWLKDQIAMRTS